MIFDLLEMFYIWNQKSPASRQGGLIYNHQSIFSYLIDNLTISFKGSRGL